MAEENITVSVHVDGMDVTLELLEEVRKSAFMAGFRSLEELDLEDEFFSARAEEAYKEWVASLDAKT